MKIVADENIPYVEELFSPFGEVSLKAGRSMAATDVLNADVLLVRSVTNVNEALIQHADLSFVGTCTIGVDHLDIPYLQSRNITYSSAPGCNANAVVQYVIGVLAQLDLLGETDKKVAIVGGGNVGSRVFKMLTMLGFDCQVVDPFLDASSGLNLAEFSCVYDADILCLHAPLTKTGAHPTEHMFASEQLQKLKTGALLINAGRGGVIDNQALLSHLKNKPDLRVVLDVWENEPGIDPLLLSEVDLGSQHIAGYSLEGRVQGSLMIYDAMCESLKLPKDKVQSVREQVCAKALGEREEFQCSSVKEAVLHAYDVTRDFENLKNAVSGLPSSFDYLRKHYPKRREFTHYRCSNTQSLSESELATLAVLGFTTE